MGVLKKILTKAKTVFRRMKSAFDKGGSYTGSPDDPASREDEKPEQDADDL